MSIILQSSTHSITGMGKLRSLTTDEILVQMYYASKICRVVESIAGIENKALPPVDNIVFMGMGEPADNADAVVRAVNTLVDRRMFGVAIKYLGLLSCTIFFNQCIHLFLRWIFCFPFSVVVSSESIIS
jgi:adenine C2-methylase RlmN of 23S rRNA A2503 and tRNA A37